MIHEGEGRGNARWRTGTGIRRGGYHQKEVGKRLTFHEWCGGMRGNCEKSGRGEYVRLKISRTDICCSLGVEREKGGDIQGGGGDRKRSRVFGAVLRGCGAMRRNCKSSWVAVLFVPQKNDRKEDLLFVGVEQQEGIIVEFVG